MSPYEPMNQSWTAKFGRAFRGLFLALRTQSSFWVHLPAAFAAISLAAFFELSITEWLAVIFAIALVVSMELLNSALEELAKQTTDEYSDHVRNSLDIGSAAVLVSSIGAVAIGVVIFLPKIIGALN